MTYRVRVSREDGYWVAKVDGVRGGATEARSLANLDVEVRDLLAGLLDVEDDAFALDWDYEPALGPAAKAVGQYHELDEAYTHLRAARDEAQAEAVRDLRGAGVSLRDAAAMLDLSFQRVQQLAS